MHHPKSTSEHTLQFYSTAAYRCSYLANRQARSLVVAPAHLVNKRIYSNLVQQGFRRSGTFTYRPYCEHCQACLPIRCDTQAHLANRTQRKIWKQHNHLLATLGELRWNPEHYQLYQRYQAARHPGQGMDDSTQSQYTEFLLQSHVDTKLVEFRNAQGQLKAVSIIDLLDDGISAVYTFYEPEPKASYGVYVILWQLQYCRDYGLPWLYLGYWIEESRKMSYKTRYHPFQLYQHGRWEWPA